MRKHELRMAVYAFESSQNGESIFIISVGGKPSALRAGALRVGRRSGFSIWRFMLSRVRRTEKAYLLYQSEESHRLYELEHCELAGVAVSLLVIVY